MKINKYVLKLYLIAFSLLMIMIIGAIWYVNNTICSNQIIEVCLSPDNRFKVVVFERDAGATSDFSTQVSIISAKSSLSNEAGNIFISDTNHGKAPSGKWGGPEASVSWSGNGAVIISYDKNVRIIKQERSFNNITIEYHELK